MGEAFLHALRSCSLCRFDLIAAGLIACAQTEEQVAAGLRAAETGVLAARTVLVGVLLTVSVSWKLK